MGRPFSGMEVVKVMVNSGIYEWDRTNGDHAILRWEPPSDHDSDARTVPVPLHDELSVGTLRDIADQAGANDFGEFRDWIDRNR
ncbi:Predicted RNA binding protein YcfA, dsRBD-like fold, HicA-like mRNA interferase family [Natronoarchaeum philippinense]|uniref:Predicted RNA binding protein YcfA, dsRBD-like fold, HicA-like mRNA interferase family n=1 Tax=Natronoarchaeum philippinense TaxID=558529 RepID=A0A285P060_NATPI|nr:Predicted RNA binding protein YcfA, dsRBD-like fold, HicA-like mRNA interferase family [Natronoarchaeum philippinense]